MNAKEKEFVAEALELLEEASTRLLDIQDSPEDPPPDAVNGAFRAMHTIKGMAGLYGFLSISEISHSLENLLDMVRMGKAQADERAMRLFFSKIEILRCLVEGIKGGSAGGEKEAQQCKLEVEEHIKSLDRKDETDTLAALSAYSDMLSVLSEYEEHRLKTNLSAGRGVYRIAVSFSLDDFDTRLKELTAKIREFGELISTMPTSDGVAPGMIGFNLIAGSDRGPDEIKTLSGYAPLVMSHPKGSAEDMAAPAQIDISASLKTATTTVRVDIGKLDRILNTVGELTLIKNNARSLWLDMSEAYGRTPQVLDLYRLIQSLNRRLLELQDEVLDIRMVPIGQIFARLGQVIRRYSKGAGKQIKLEVFGEETEIDKHLAEEMVDPLLHIVRNAIDHGIEAPDARGRAEKDPVGTVRLKAAQRGNSVVIEVSDDGGGIDIERVREKAVEKGLLTTSGHIEDKEILDFMFMPGFSTKDTVTETSGRGVGLDVVRETLSELGGFVEIKTEQDKGTTFILTLPITLAIVKALMVRAGNEVFAVPLSAIQETFILSDDEIQHVEGGEVYNLRGELLPLVRLGVILCIQSARPERSFAIVAGHGERRMAILVDELASQQEIVIKPLSEYFEGLPVFAGAAEVSSNEVVLVLDIEGFISTIIESRRVFRAK